MIRGLQLRGELIRSLRLAKGWSQLDLAQQAGVGERTIRNAESGKIVEASTATYIAGALKVTLDILGMPFSRASTPFSISHFELAFREAFFARRIAPLQEMLMPNCLWRIVGIPSRDSTSVAHSYEQLTEIFDAVRSHLPSQNTHEWELNHEDSVSLTDTFIIVATFVSHTHPPLRLRCNTVGRLKKQRCSQVTQAWDEDVMEH